MENIKCQFDQMKISINHKYNLPQQGKDKHYGAVDREEPREPHGRFKFVTQQELLRDTQIIYDHFYIELTKHI